MINTKHTNKPDLASTRSLQTFGQRFLLNTRRSQTTISQHRAIISHMLFPPDKCEKCLGTDVDQLNVILRYTSLNEQSPRACLHNSPPAVDLLPAPKPEQESYDAFGPTITHSLSSSPHQLAKCSFASSDTHRYLSSFSPSFQSRPTYRLTHTGTTQYHPSRTRKRCTLRPCTHRPGSRQCEASEKIFPHMHKITYTLSSPMIRTLQTTFTMLAPLFRDKTRKAILWPSLREHGNASVSQGSPLAYLKGTLIARPID